MEAVVRMMREESLIAVVVLIILFVVWWVMARKVWYIYQGSESPERFDLLVSLTGLRSPSQIGALRDHLVKGVQLDAAMVMNEVTNKSNLERDLIKINDIATTVEKIKEIDWLKARENKLIVWLSRVTVSDVDRGHPIKTEHRLSFHNTSICDTYCGVKLCQQS